MLCHSLTVVREKLQAGEICKVLAVRASRLGDLLITTPTLHAFRKRWPACRIHFLTNKYCEDLLQENPDIDETHVFDGRERALGSLTGKRLAKTLAPIGFDLLLALRPRRELESFAERLKIPFLWPPAALDPEERADGQPTGHVVERCFARIARLGIEGVPGPMHIYLTDKEISAARELVPRREGSLVLAHPGCDETWRWKPRRGVRRRLWPVSHWVELIDRLQEDLGAQVLLSSGSRVEGLWVEKIRHRCKTRPVHLNRPSMRSFCAVVKNADLVVTIDTGPLHLATALGVPLLGLYGASPPEYTGPWGTRVRVERFELPCSPCQGKGAVCRRNVCMEEIKPEQVLASARALLHPFRLTSG